VLLCALLSACTSPTDALYDATQPPAVPVRPEPARADACEACADEKCFDPHAACLRDTTCLALLECRGRCSDPACTDACVARHGHSPFYEDLWTCVLTDHCAEACGAGESFACVDAYEAARAAQDDDSFPVRFRYQNPRTGLAYAYTGDQRDEQFVAGAQAQSCLPPGLAGGACQRIDEGTVGADDSVELGLVVHEVTRAFVGVVEVALPDATPAPAAAATTEPPRFRQLGWNDRYYPPPFTEPTEFRFYVFWRGWIREKAIAAGGEPLDFATAAPLALYLPDCLGAPARGVHFELPSVAGVTLLHQADDGSVGDVSDTGSAMITDVPEPARDTALEVRAVLGDDRVVARRSEVFVRPGTTTHVWLTPSPVR
jgi:hypothetical protein